MNKTKGYICIAVATFLFSTMEIALKTVAGDFNPVQMTFSRFAIGGLVLLPFALAAMKKKGVKLTGKVMGKLMLLGFTGIFISMSMYQMAIAYTKASVVAVLFSCNPLFVTIFASIFLGEKIERKSIVALIFEIAGILMIIAPWNMQLSLPGIALSIGAALAFALYGVLGKRESESYGGVVTTCFSFLFGSVEMMLAAAISHIPAVESFLIANHMDTFAAVPFFAGYSMANMLPVIYIAVGVTGIGFAAYFMAMENVEAQTASLVFFFKPVLAPILAMLILGEIIPVNMVLGIVLLLVGSFASLFGDRIAGLMAQTGRS